MDQTPQTTSPPPSTSSRNSRSTTHQRVQVKTLCDPGWLYNRIAKHLGINRGQVRYVAQVPYVEVKTSPARPTVLSKNIDEVEVFNTSTPEGRRILWLELLHGPFRHFEVSERVLKRELQKRGYARHPALKKPPPSEVNKQKRLTWAEAHKDWTLDDWMSIL